MLGNLTIRKFGVICFLLYLSISWIYRQATPVTKFANKSIFFPFDTFSMYAHRAKNIVLHTTMYDASGKEVSYTDYNSFSCSYKRKKTGCHELAHRSYGVGYLEKNISQYIEGNSGKGRIILKQMNEYWKLEKGNQKPSLIKACMVRKCLAQKTN